MNWLNKLLRNASQKPAKAAASVTQAPAVAPAVDVRQLRQCLTQTLVQEERERLERGLGAALAQSKQALLVGESAGVRAAAVMQAADQATALAWLVDLTGDERLLEVALHARFAEVRRAAAQRLESTAVLERVAEVSRVKDKGVYRHCLTVLHERRSSADNAARASSLERELESLQLVDPVPVARLVPLEKALSQLGSGGHGRCNALFEQLKARAQEQSRTLQRLHARQAAAQSLVDELAHPLQEEQHTRLHGRWKELLEACAEWPPWLAEHKDLKALCRLLNEIEIRLAQAAEDLARLRQAEAFLAMHSQEAPLTQESISAWASLAKPDNLHLRAELQSRWEACLNKAAHKVQQAQQALKPPPIASPIDCGVLQQRLDQLEAALEQGHLAAAIKREAAISLPNNAAAAGLPPALSQRLARARAQLLQLRGWARWGTDQARQQLIFRAEQLVQENPDVAARSGAIVELRKEWKALDVSGVANHALWERFDAALEQAYAPVAAYRAELAARRSAARLDAGIAAARNREISRRELLIAAAEALREEAELGLAIEGVKVLQQRWRDETGGVKLGRAEQEKLWRKFRGVCDAIFARRDEEKARQLAQRALRAEQERQRLAALDLRAQQRHMPYELMARKMAIAEQIEGAAVAGMPLENLMHEAQASWRNLPRLPGKFERALARRLADAPGIKAATFAEGRQVRERLLLDLELALGLDLPDGQDESRQARHLELLQQRFRKNSSAEVDTEQLIVAWHATPAAQDKLQQQRMDAILRKMLPYVGNHAGK